MSTQREESTKLPLVAEAAADFHYTRMPTLLLNSDGVITVLNAACRELLGLDVAGCLGQHYSSLAERLETKTDGSIPPPTGIAATRFDASNEHDRGAKSLALQTRDLAVATSECVYHSARLGSLALRVTELPRIDIETGACIGSMICLEPQWTGNSKTFQNAIDRRLSHEVMWEVYAASYDRVLSQLPFYQEVVQRHCDAMQGPEIENLLDVGAGTGIATLRLLRLGKQVTAVDINQAMLRRMYAKLDQENSRRLTIIEDTAEYLPQLADASFDGVSVLLAYFDMDDPWSALQESIRVLKPGGTLIITDPRSCFDVDEIMAFAEESLRARNLFEVLEQDWHRIKTVAPLIRDTICQIQSPRSAASSNDAWHAEAVFQSLSEAGFLDTTFCESHLGNCATVTGTKPASA